MKECNKCGCIFTPTKGLLNYCSIKCRNSRGPRTEEEKRKIQDSVNSWLESRGKKRVETAAGLKNPRSKLLKIKEKLRLTSNEKLLSEDFNTLKFERLRKRIILEQDGKCNNCGIITWLEKPIVLELEHINGIRADNSRENLEAICPNCHSQTNTWRGKNKNYSDIQNKRISDEELLELLIQTKFNIRQALISSNLAPKGRNYERCYKLIKLLSDE